MANTNNHNYDVPSEAARLECVASLVKEACAIRAMQNDDDQYERIRVVLRGHAMTIALDGLGAIATSCMYLKGEQLKTALSAALLRAKMIPSHPIDIVFKHAKCVFADCPVFFAGDLEERFAKRHLATLALSHVQSNLVTAVRSRVKGNVTVVVSGHSGDGKTCSLLLAASRTERRVVVYLYPNEDIDDETLPTTREGRNAAVLAFLMKELMATLPAAVQKEMKKFATDSRYASEKPLTVVVAVDEMGAHTQAVRAMCAIGGGALKKALGDEWGVDDRITFSLAIAGTGVGWSQGYSKKRFLTAVGSNPKTFEHVFASRDKDSRDSNFTVFADHLGCIREETKKSIAEIMARHPFFDDMVRGNTRLAAIAGHTLRMSFDVSHNTFTLDTLQWLEQADLMAFLGPVLADFKNRNALRDVRPSDFFPMLLRAVRMHALPFEVTDKARSFEITTGLVQSRFLSKEERAAGKSPVSLPPFSVGLLASFVGQPAITQSVVGGEALEQYVLAVFFLLACAAASANTFVEMLRGSMSPVLKQHVKQGTVNSTGGQPAASSVRLHMAVNDMLRMKLDVPDTKATSETASVAASEAVPTAISHPFVADVRKVLANHFGDVKEARGGANRFIAAFRSPDKAQFADVFIFVDDTLFLFQCKDLTTTTLGENEVALELWKMGEASDGVAEALKQKANAKAGDGTTGEPAAMTNQEVLRKHSGPQQVLEGLIDAYYEITKRQVVHVRRYFVGCRQWNIVLPDEAQTMGATGGWSVALHPARNVSVDGIDFLRFNPDRARQAPPAFLKLPNVEIPVTPQLKDASESRPAIPSTAEPSKKKRRSEKMKAPDRSVMLKE